MNRSFNLIQNTPKLKRIQNLIVFTIISLNTIAQSHQQNHIFQWIGHPAKIQTLDSLIQQSTHFALDQKDYNTTILKIIVKNSNRLNNYKDSLNAELGIQRTATHFFNDLAYGNRPPLLDYRGAKFDMTTFNIPALIKSYYQKNQLVELVQILNQQGYLGRSLGCPAVPNNKVEAIIKAIQGASCLFVYAPDKKYMQNSSLIN